MDKLGLFKYADELRSARDRVLQGSSDSGWAVFGYEGQTNVLKLAEAGEDLEEGFQALDANRIMYMYARVIDPNSQLAKYVLINWCGTGAPEMRKAVCATHVPEVCRFLTKIHVTMNVRSEDELSVENLQLRVAKASGANYNAGAAVQNVKPSTAPRPSNATGYVRPNAAAEIQASNREKFWEGHDKDDEAARKNDEAKRKAETQARFAPVKAAKPPVFAASASTANSNGGASQATSAKPAAALLSERDRFWAEQEAEEQRRREEEKRRIEEERQRREAETRERELKAAVKREAEAKARAEQIVTRKQYTAAAEASAPRTQTPASTATDAASDENERGKRPDAAKHARQQEIQALIKARNAQGDAPDSSLSKRADDLRSQRQEEIRKMMAQRGGVDDEEEERRRRAEELRKQREREMQEAFAKRSDTADTEEDERRRRADELRRNRQEEMRQTIGASGSAQPSVIATRNPPVVQPQSAPPFRPNPPVIPSPVVAAPEPVVHTEAPARPYIPPMAKQVLPGPRTALPVESQYQPTPAPAPAPALAPAPAPVAPVSIGVNPLAAAAAAIATNYTAQSGANINDSPNNASQKYFYKAGSSGQPSPSGSPTKDSRSSTYGNNEPAPYYADPEQTNDESEPQDVYQNVPYVSNNANSTGRAAAAAAPAAPAQEPPQDNNFYVNEQVSRGQRASMNRVSDLYEPVSFGATQSAKRSSYRNANDDDELDAPRSNTTSNSNTVRALYDYEAQDSDEISFSVDELITEVQQIDSGWWLGTNQSGKTGMFPANYVATFSDS